MMVVAAVSGAASTDSQNIQIQKVNSNSQDETQINPRRPPLLPSEKDNKGQNPRRLKSRVVSSRYMSPSPSPSTSTSNSSSVSSTSSSSRRFPSPLVSRNSTTVASSPALVPPKRSVSVDRRRPVSAAARPSTSDLDSKLCNGNELSAATKLLVTATRSLSVSFQGESFSLPISKTKAAPPTPNLSSVRKGTPERRRSGTTPLRGKIDGGADQVENSKPVDQHRWPGRTREMNPTSRSLDRSVGERSKLTGSGNVIRSLQQSMIDERRASIDRRRNIDYSNADVSISRQYAPDDNSLHNQFSNASDLTASDTDSVSSGSTSGVHECGGTSCAKSGPRGIAVSARFWQETNSRLRRLQDPGSPLSTSPSSRLIVPPKLKKFPIDGPVSSPRAISSPVRGAVRAASPSKLVTSVASSPSRGMSPSRVRNAVSTISSNFGETPSVLSFAVDVRRSKVGENRIADAHQLRLLYNRHMQWRFVNARTESVSMVQKRSVEKDLWNAWITISDLRDAVTKKRHRLQLIRQKLKLAAILKGQVTCLEDWASLEKDQSISLLGAIEALKASTLRLPIVGGATTDIQSLKEAIGSAVDVMHAATSSICSIQKIDEVNAMMTELARVAAKEQVLIEHCKDLLAMVAATQVKDCSLRTHVLQHNRLSPIRLT